MKKVFRKRTDHLRVTVTNDEKIFLPQDDGRVEIGTYEQTTIQKIPLKHIDTLYQFVLGENKKANKQRDNIQQQLDNMKEIDETISDEFIQKTSDSLKIILDKKNFMKEAEEEDVFDEEAHKKAMEEMIILTRFVGEVQKKKALVMQIEFIDTQLKQGNIELKDLKEAIK